MSGYAVYVTPLALADIRELPGHVRQRVRRAIDSLAADARPTRSKRMNVPELPAELRRLRLDRWRIVYLVSDADFAVDVLAVRRRPPYDYGDVEQLLAGLG